MSALPQNALVPSTSTNRFLELANDRTDEAILSDRDVYELKGGDSFFVLKLGAGVGSFLLFSALTGRLPELRSMSLRSSTFFFGNLWALSGMSLAQNLYLRADQNRFARYKLHQHALFNRYVLNWGFVNENRKKPKVH